MILFFQEDRFPNHIIDLEPMLVPEHAQRWRLIVVVCITLDLWEPDFVVCGSRIEKFTQGKITISEIASSDVVDVKTKYVAPHKPALLERKTSTWSALEREKAFFEGYEAGLVVGPLIKNGGFEIAIFDPQPLDAYGEEIKPEIPLIVVHPEVDNGAPGTEPTCSDERVTNSFQCRNNIWMGPQPFALTRSEVYKKIQCGYRELIVCPHCNRSHCFDARSVLRLIRVSIQKLSAFMEHIDSADALCRRYLAAQRPDLLKLLIRLTRADQSTPVRGEECDQRTKKDRVRSNDPYSLKHSCVVIWLPDIAPRNEAEKCRTDDCRREQYCTPMLFVSREIGFAVVVITFDHDVSTVFSLRSLAMGSFCRPQSLEMAA